MSNLYSENYFNVAKQLMEMEKEHIICINCFKHKIVQDDITKVKCKNRTKIGGTREGVEIKTRTTIRPSEQFCCKDFIADTWVDRLDIARQMVKDMEIWEDITSG